VILTTLAMLTGAFKSKTPILTYHDVIAKRDKTSVWFDCTVDEFESQMQWLKRQGAVFVSIHDVKKALLSKTALPKNAVCVTFADNYQGFYRYAYPYIKKHRIPVAQFVHTDFVGSVLGRPKMSWRQLQELERSGLVSVESQTCSHPADVSKLSKAARTHELRDSKLKIEQMLKKRVTALAYPNGMYNSTISMEAQKQGYEIAFTEVCKPVELAPNLWQVPRYVHTKYREAWRDGKE
jgi:peptidoglycan/xylan/chitin deacetylase (PgdA/CDA1 family)